MAEVQFKSGEPWAADAFWTVFNNLPFVNLWYTRQALDLAILNDFQEWMNPGTFRRREAQMKKDFGQTCLVDPLAPQPRVLGWSATGVDQIARTDLRVR